MACVVQSQGNALWLFAYFGYWLEIFIIIGIKLLRGKLTDANHKRSPAVMRAVAEHEAQPKDKVFDVSASESGASSRPSSDSDVKAKAKAKAIELQDRPSPDAGKKPVPLESSDNMPQGMDDKVPAWVGQDAAAAATSPKRPVQKSDFYV